MEKKRRGRPKKQEDIDPLVEAGFAFGYAFLLGVVGAFSDLREVIDKDGTDAIDLSRGENDAPAGDQESGPST